MANDTPRYPRRAGRVSRDPHDLRRERPVGYSATDLAADRGTERGTATELATLASFLPGPAGVIGGGAEAGLEGRGLPGIAIAAGLGALPGPKVLKFPKRSERAARDIGKIKERVNALDQRAGEVQETLRGLVKQQDEASAKLQQAKQLGVNPQKASKSDIALAIRREKGLSPKEARAEAERIKEATGQFQTVRQQQDELRSEFLEIDRELAELRQQEDSLMQQINPPGGAAPGVQVAGETSENVGRYMAQDLDAVQDMWGRLEDMGLPRGTAGGSSPTVGAIDADLIYELPEEEIANRFIGRGMPEGRAAEAAKYAKKRIKEIYERMGGPK